MLSRAGEHDAPGEIVDLERAAADAIERWSTFAAEHGQRLELRRRIGARTWAARADVDRALDALVENAVLYSPPGTRVMVSAGAGAIAVEDEGPGLRKGEEDEVFERFHRGRAGTEGPPGTGLGLPIARELARRWGGDATIENRNGRGARAILQVPRLYEPFTRRWLACTVCDAGRLPGSWPPCSGWRSPPASWPRPATCRASASGWHRSRRRQARGSRPPASLATELPRLDPSKVTTTTTPSAPAPTAPSQAQGEGDGDADADD